MYTYTELAFRQSCLAYTIQDLQNELKCEKNEEKINSLKETIDKYVKEFNEILLMIENKEYIEDELCKRDDNYDEFVTNGQIAERIESCYDY